MGTEPNPPTKQTLKGGGLVHRKVNFKAGGKNPHGKRDSTLRHYQRHHQQHLIH